MGRTALCIRTAPRYAGRAMDANAWLTLFEDTLRELRPHLSAKVASAIGRQLYDPAVDPKAAAKAYHSRQTPAPAAKPTKRNR